MNWNSIREKKSINKFKLTRVINDWEVLRGI